MRTQFLAALLLAAPATIATAQPMLQQQVEARLAQAGPGLRFGLVVADETGRELVAINPDSRFIPASNTKILTTVAAYGNLNGIEGPDQQGGAEIRLERAKGAADVVLVGHGDARLSSAPDCRTDCLAALADAVAARVKKVRNVVGDDSAYADDRWSPGMSWNNIPHWPGTGVSALTLDDNELPLGVAPGAAAGAPALLTHSGYYRIVNLTRTVTEGETDIDFDRRPSSFDLVVTGTIRADAKPLNLRMAIDDPALYAASRLKALLEARGVRVTGGTVARHRPLGVAVIAAQGSAIIAPAPAPLARLTPPPVAEDIVRINKESQNLHAELMLRRLGAANGEPSIKGGLKAVTATLATAGVPRSAWDLSDGSGMSTYNRVSPRAIVALLRWVSRQSWSENWKASLPIAGVDGTLANRFKDSALQGKLIAKTGTINASNALSGWLTTKSGRSLTFSFFANDVPEKVKATEAMDAALLIVAQAN
jgi:D-alanyl-D-alanine carboxypeptidase/D-alanyl-D-alanine-endopeptidase (penicillin-binding protein 4)